MWPWGHLAVGYLAYALLLDRRLRRPPDDLAAIVLVLATQLPDLVDKPLAWYLAVLPHGRSLAHSALVAGVTVALVVRYATGRDRRDLGVAFGVGYLTHLAGDTLGPVLAHDFADLGFLGWPLLAVPRYEDTPSIGAYFAALFRDLAAFQVAPLLALEFVLVVLAAGLWARHCFPGLPRLRPARDDRDT